MPRRKKHINAVRAEEAAKAALAEVAVTQPQLARDAATWGRTRVTQTQLRARWGSLQRVAVGLYAAGMSQGQIQKVLYMDRQDLRLKLKAWAAANTPPSARDD